MTETMQALVVLEPDSPGDPGEAGPRAGPPRGARPGARDVHLRHRRAPDPRPLPRLLAAGLPVHPRPRVGRRDRRPRRRRGGLRLGGGRPRRRHQPQRLRGLPEVRRGPATTSARTTASPACTPSTGTTCQGCDATYVVHDVKCVFRLPDEVSFDEGAVIDPASIALHVARRGNIKPGDTVVGHRRGRDRPARRRRGAHLRRRPGGRRRPRLPAGEGRRDGLRDRRHAAGDPVAAVRELTGGLGADVVLECAGVPETLTWAMAMLRRGGRCAMVGIPTEDVALRLQPLVLDELELVGSRASAGEMRRVMPVRRQRPDACRPS